MLESPTPIDFTSESDRVAALHDLAILDSPAEREFDEITRLAATALGASSAAISLIDEERQWFKSRHGIPFAQTPREIAFCTYAVGSRDILVVPNATLDERFRTNPLVNQDGGVRFYVGVPLIISTGYCIGTLCVFDPCARPGLTDVQRALLVDLAKLAADLIDSRRYRRMGEIAARMVDATSDAILGADQDGKIIYWNVAAEQMFGRSRDAAIGCDVEIIIPERLAKGHRETFARAAAGGETRLVGNFVELVAARADGTEFAIELSLARWGVSAPDAGFAAIVRDISKRKELERERESSKAFLDTVVRNLPAMLFVKDAVTRRYLMVNRSGEAAIGKTAEDMVGRTDCELFPEYGKAYETRDTEAMAAASAQTFESEFIRDDGTAVHLRTTRSLIDGPDRPGQYILGISEDVTATRVAEAQVFRLAHYDTLTGAHNRASFTDRLHRLVQSAEPFALLSIDLDRFKAVNDQFGHLVGDSVLADVANRLREAIAHTDWVARVGGDEFVVVISGHQLRERAADVASTIVDQLAMPFETTKGIAYTGASIGIVMKPDDGSTTAQLRENADLALYRAKQIGKGTACFFSAEMDAAAQDRRQLEQDFRAAVASDEIELVYQPVLSAKTGQITSAEALARWTHRDRGPVRPDVFIPLAEECGLIDRLGEKLLHRACRDAQTWPDEIRVAVNLSPLQFLSGCLVGTVRKALATSQLRADRLQLEVTEGLVIRDVERTFQQLEELRALGIQVLMDDFGVGYSSLSYFQRFPFDKVKLDKSFVDEIGTSRAARAIVKAVVGLGDALGMGVVAEGVETEEQMRQLVASGCTHFQGYLFSRPIPTAALCEILTGTRRSMVGIDAGRSRAEKKPVPTAA